MCQSLGESSEEPVFAANESWSGRIGNIKTRNSILRQSDAMDSIMREESESVSVQVGFLCQRDELSILTCPESTTELFGGKANTIFNLEANGK